MNKKHPLKYFKTSPEVIRLAIWYYVKFHLSYRDVEDILHERGFNITYATIRFWVIRFVPLFAKEIQKKRFWMKFL